MQRKLSELESEFNQLGLTFKRPLRRSKAGTMDYILALQDYYMDIYRSQGKSTYGMEWVWKNLESSACHFSDNLYRR